ncbi:MAG: C-GCAxxG-C-C family (seleno)protein [Bacillota bacterium]
MSDGLILEARQKAGGYFREGFNCGEAVLLSFKDLLFPNLDPGVVKLATGFGGGMGHAGCVCGALAAGTMVLGMMKGRTSPQESREEAYQLAHQWHERFEAEFSHTCCRALNPYPFETPEHLRNCLKITGNTAKLLMGFLQEKGLVDESKKELA